MLFTGKYEGRSLTFAPPHVVVLTNSELPPDVLSADRVIFIEANRERVTHAPMVVPVEQAEETRVEQPLTETTELQCTEAIQTEEAEDAEGLGDPPDLTHEVTQTQETITGITFNKCYKNFWESGWPRCKCRVCWNIRESVLVYAYGENWRNNKDANPLSKHESYTAHTNPRQKVQYQN
jgi:hypothetical protein